MEFATLEWVAWYNTRRRLEPLGYVPPVEFERPTTTARRLRPSWPHSRNRVSGEAGAVHIPKDEGGSTSQLRSSRSGGSSPENREGDKRGKGSRRSRRAVGIDFADFSEMPGTSSTASKQRKPITGSLAPEHGVGHTTSPWPVLERWGCRNHPQPRATCRCFVAADHGDHSALSRSRWTILPRRSAALTEAKVVEIDRDHQ